LPRKAAGLRGAFVVAGLAARRRDLPRLAYVWARSNGFLARGLGRAGWLLVPVTWMYWLLLAARFRFAAVRSPRAGAVVRNPDGKVPTDVAALAGAALIFIATWLVYSVALATVLPAAGYLASIWLLVLIVAVDAAGELVWIRWRSRGQRAAMSLTAQATALDAVSVVFVAAYPRSGGAGTALMEAINAVLDQRGQPAVLDARTSELIAYYERGGYAPLGAGRRLLRKPR
jgi:hypothetical protein